MCYEICLHFHAALFCFENFISLWGIHAIYLSIFFRVTTLALSQTSLHDSWNIILITAFVWPGIIKWYHTSVRNNSSSSMIMTQIYQYYLKLHDWKHHQNFIFSSCAVSIWNHVTTGFHNDLVLNWQATGSISWVFVLHVIMKLVHFHINLGIGSANERHHYNVTASLIGWAHTQTSLWFPQPLHHPLPICTTSTDEVSRFT